MQTNDDSDASSADSSSIHRPASPPPNTPISKALSDLHEERAAKSKCFEIIHHG